MYRWMMLGYLLVFLLSVATFVFYVTDNLANGDFMLAVTGISFVFTMICLRLMDYLDATEEKYTEED